MCPQAVTNFPTSEYLDPVTGAILGELELGTELMEPQPEDEPKPRRRRKRARAPSLDAASDGEEGEGGVVDDEPEAETTADGGSEAGDGETVMSTARGG